MLSNDKIILTRSQLYDLLLLSIAGQLSVSDTMELFEKQSLKNDTKHHSRESDAFMQVFEVCATHRNMTKENA
jgi:hypothetical protein